MDALNQTTGGVVAHEASPSRALREIRVMPPALADRIAAGEVVERPASVVKELVENSLDGGARFVEVRVEGAGVDGIAVLDDGAGMRREMLRVAVLRHATSKIHNEGELDAIVTLGFRGEALASIAAVSRLTLTSRVAGAEEGARLMMEGSEIISESMVGAPLGTRVDVRDLFFNMPARRKFLKTAATERAQIVDTMTRIALTRADVHFRLVQEGREVFDLPAGMPLAQRAARCIGPEVRDQLHPFDGGVEPVRVHGLIAPPEVNFGSARGLLPFVNGRFVRDRVVIRAAQDAFEGMVPRGRYPIALVFVEVPPEEVDVNVHPQKYEVRFKPGLPVHLAIRKAVSGALVGYTAQAAHVGGPSLPERTARETDKIIEALKRYEAAHGASAGAGSSALFHDEEVAAPRRVAVTASGAAGGAVSGRTYTMREGGTQRGYTPRLPMSPTTLPLARGGAGDGATGGAAGGAASGAASGAVGLPASSVEAPAKTHVSPYLMAPSGGYASLRVVGQLHGTYVLCESDDGLVVFDQHAAHERVTYTRLMDSYFSGGVLGQPMLIPVRVDLPPAEVERAVAHGEALEKLGVHVEPFGDNAVRITEVPAGFERADWGRLLRELIADLDETGSGAVFEAKVRAVCALMACHGSVRAHDKLSHEEMRELLRQMDETEKSSRCPHGRPVAVRVALPELERWFNRH